MKLIYILIVILLAIMIFQVFFDKDTLVEGLESDTTTSTNTSTTEYQPYNLSDPNSALILSQQNAGNINYLKERIDELTSVKKDVDDLKQNVSLMQTQIDGLVQQQADFGTELAGSTPPTITGTETETISTTV